MNHATTSKKTNSYTHHTLELKCKVLSHLSSVNDNISQCARDYSIDRRTIGKWKKQQKDIYESSHRRRSFRVNNKKNVGYYPVMESSLNDWIIEKRAIGGCITGKDVKSKAAAFFIEHYTNCCNDKQFQASDGWLRNFFFR
jgi:hypothetical protein